MAAQDLFGGVDHQIETAGGLQSGCGRHDTEDDEEDFAWEIAGGLAHPKDKEAHAQRGNGSKTDAAEAGAPDDAGQNDNQVDSEHEFLNRGGGLRSWRRGREDS